MRVCNKYNNYNDDNSDDKNETDWKQLVIFKRRLTSRLGFILLHLLNI
jgi:hypothetical protein